MMNTVRINEIRKRMSDIEQAQEEASTYIKKLQQVERTTHDELRGRIRGIESEFKRCEGDLKLTRLVEERYEILQELERGCDENLTLCEEEQRRITNQCESEMEELRLELTRLEMM